MVDVVVVVVGRCVTCLVGLLVVCGLVVAVHVQALEGTKERMNVLKGEGDSLLPADSFQ